VRSHGRTTQRRRRLPTEDHGDGLHSGPRQIDTLSLRDLRRAFARLPEPNQEVIVLVAIKGMAYKDAARVLEVLVGTVRSRLSRARSQLRAMMDGTEPAVALVQRGVPRVLIATGASVSVHHAAPRCSGAAELGQRQREDPDADGTSGRWSTRPCVRRPSIALRAGRMDSAKQREASAPTDTIRSSVAGGPQMSSDGPQGLPASGAAGKLSRPLPP
jgi:hypothetical protein